MSQKVPENPKNQIWQDNLEILYSFSYSIFKKNELATPPKHSAIFFCRLIYCIREPLLKKPGVT